MNHMNHKSAAETKGTKTQSLEAEVKQLKEESGRPVIGYLCCFAPPEIIAAAGALPYRITGIPGADSSAADSYMEPYGCSYVRNILSRAASGNLDFLDGLVISHSCDMVQRLYGIWTYYRPLPFSYLFNVPHQILPPSQRFFKRELRFFQAALEKFTGTAVTEEALRETICTYNQNRALVRKLYRLREEDPPGIKGSEVLKLLLSGGALPAERFNKIIKHFLSTAQSGEQANKGVKRLLVWGSIIDDPALYIMVEKAGAAVVADDTCIGSRTFEHDVPLEGDLYENLKDHYLVNFQCPRTDRGPGLGRFDYILEKARRYKADGVIAYIISFCDPHKFDYPDLRDYLKSKGLPLLLVDDNYSFEPKGALETRLQAFMEMLL